MNVHKPTLATHDRKPRRRSGRPRSVSNEAIFAVVSEVIARAGPTGLSLSAIGETAGLSASALVQRFGSKRGLLLAYAARGPSFLDDVFDNALESNNSPLHAMKTALQTLASPVRTRKSLANNLAFLQMDLIDPDLRVHAIHHSRQLRHRIHELLEQALLHGELTTETDVEALAQTLYITYNGALITWAIDGKRTLRHWLRQSVDAALMPHIATSTEQCS